MFLKPPLYTSCLLYSTKCISLPFTLARSEGFRHIYIYIYIWITMWVSYKKQELTILRGQMSSPWVIFLCPIMCLYVLNYVLWSPLWFLHITRCSVRLYLQLFVGGLMSYLHYLCLLSSIGVQHILCCIFVLSFFVLCTLCYQFLWIVHFLRHFRYSLTFIIYVYILTYVWPYVAGVGEFNLLIKSPSKAWRFIVFASFLIIIIIIIIIIIYYHYYYYYYYSSSS